VDIWRNIVQEQLGQKSQQDLTQQISWAWWHTPVNLSYVRGINGIAVQTGLGENARDYSKIKVKRARGIAQVVEHIFTKH
jgi:hypothetical protein